MNEPSKEAMEAVTELYRHGFIFDVEMKNAATIIDRHFPRQPSAAWMELLEKAKENVYWKGHALITGPTEKAIAAVEAELKGASE